MKTDSDSDKMYTAEELQYIRTVLVRCFKCGSPHHMAKRCKSVERPLSLEEICAFLPSDSLAAWFRECWASWSLPQVAETRAKVGPYLSSEVNIQKARKAPKALKAAVVVAAAKTSAAVSASWSVEAQLLSVAPVAADASASSEPGEVVESLSPPSSPKPGPTSVRVRSPASAPKKPAAPSPKASPPHPYHQGKKIDSIRSYRESDGNIVEESVGRWSCCNMIVGAYDDRCKSWW